MFDKNYPFLIVFSVTFLCTHQILPCYWDLLPPDIKKVIITQCDPMTNLRTSRLLNKESLKLVTDLYRKEREKLHKLLHSYTTALTTFTEKESSRFNENFALLVPDSSITWNPQNIELLQKILANSYKFN